MNSLSGDTASVPVLLKVYINVLCCAVLCCPWMHGESSGHMVCVNHAGHSSAELGHDV